MNKLVIECETPEQLEMLKELLDSVLGIGEGYDFYGCGFVSSTKPDGTIEILEEVDDTDDVNDL